MSATSPRPHLRIIRLPLVIERTGLSRSSIYEHISNGNFPKQVSLGPHSVGWVENEINAWIEARISASRMFN